MAQNPVYVQTAKGRAEVSAKPGALGPNLKMLLALVNGESTVEDLNAKLRVDAEKLKAALEKLAADGYIERAEPAAAAGPADFETFMGQPHREPTAERKRDAEQQTLTSMRSLRKAGYSVNILNRPAGKIAPRSGGRHSVLILDGDQASTLMLARTLMQAKFDVRSASRRDQIMEELNKPAPDIIVMDVILPELVGLDVLAKLREHPTFKSVPVIVITAQTTQDDVVAALVYGANGFMSKPAKPEDVLESVQTILGLN